MGNRCHVDETQLLVRVESLLYLCVSNLGPGWGESLLWLGLALPVWRTAHNAYLYLGCNDTRCHQRALVSEDASLQLAASEWSRWGKLYACGAQGGAPRRREDGTLLHHGAIMMQTHGKPSCLCTALHLHGRGDETCRTCHRQMNSCVHLPHTLQAAHWSRACCIKTEPFNSHALHM